MKNFRMLLMATWLGGMLPAQGQTPMSMEACMRYAVEHSTGVRQQRYETESQRAEARAALGAFLPTVSSSVSGQYNWGRGIDPETNTYTDITTFNNGYSIAATLRVFDGGQTANQWLRARTLRRQSETELQRLRDDKAVEVMEAFVEVVYGEACVTLAAEKLAESEQLLHKTTLQEELGIKGPADVAQMRAQVATDDYTLTHRRNLRDAALLTLKQAMNYPAEADLTVDTARRSRDDVALTSDAESIYRYAAAHHPLALSARLDVRGSQLSYRIARGKLLPTISLQAGIFTNYYRNISGGAETAHFGSQLRNNRGEYVAANLSIPLFDGWARRRDVRKARNDWRKAALQEEETLRQLQADVEQAVMDLRGYMKEVEQLERKVAADGWAHHVSVRKYEEGLMDAIDVQTSGNTLLESRALLLQKQMLLWMKQKLVAYYQGEELTSADGADR